MARKVFGGTCLESSSWGRSCSSTCPCLGLKLLNHFKNLARESRGIVLIIVLVISAAGLGLSMEEAGAAAAGTATAMEAAVMVAAGLKADMVWPIPLGLTWGMPLGLV